MERQGSLAEVAAISAGSYPSHLQYMKFPKSICTSVNEVICMASLTAEYFREGILLTVI
jgi:methionyl aminopeptidase